MFGLGFSEMVMIAIVLLVVVGPKELPKLLRAVGGGINKLRRMSSDLREQSRIDEILSDEGLREDLETLRSLRGISRGRIVDSLVAQASHKPRPRTQQLPDSSEQDQDEELPAIELDGVPPDPQTEYPAIGPDAYGSLAEDDPYAGVEPAEEAPPEDAAEQDEPTAASTETNETAAPPEADGHEGEPS